MMDDVNDPPPERISTQPESPAAGRLRSFVGRSQGAIQISDADLMAPVGEDWEVDADL